MDRNGIITAGYNAEIGRSVTFDVFHGRTLSWEVAAGIRGDALADLLESEKMLLLFKTVRAGHTLKWNGNNTVGRLTDDARAASDEIETALTALDEDESAMVAVWDVSQWLENNAFDDIWESGNSLTEAVTAVEESAEAESVELDGNVERYLLDRAEKANERGKCFRPEVLAALRADKRHPVDEDGEEWQPGSGYPISVKILHEEKTHCESGQATDDVDDEKAEPRDMSVLRQYRDEMSAAQRGRHDPLITLIKRLINGDESVRSEVERGLDRISADFAGDE
jgi:hypothetical protein